MALPDVPAVGVPLVRRSSWGWWGPAAAGWRASGLEVYGDATSARWLSTFGLSAAWSRSAGVAVQAARAE